MWRQPEVVGSNINTSIELPYALCIPHNERLVHSYFIFLGASPHSSPGNVSASAALRFILGF